MYFAIGVGHGKGELSPRKRQGTDSPFDGKVETGYRCREAKWTEAGLGQPRVLRSCSLLR